ncbi:MAG: hypothetical protein H6594_07450 [Flavobacteriales bacterium]|nr:hypothetical protein [Flavobacteriales bacterium]
MKTLTAMIGTLTISLVFANSGFGQDRTKDLAVLNDLYAGSVKFRIDRDDRLIADLFDDSGHFREDAVYIEFLDPDLFAFSPEENAVVLKCRDDQGQCIEKEVFKLNVIRRTGRSALPAPADDASGRKAIALLQQLVRGVQLARTSETDETRARPNRNK